MTVSTTKYALGGQGASNSYVDLGPGPLRVEVLADTAVFVQSDTQPADSAQGFTYSYPANPPTFDTTSHIWAKGANGTISAAVIVVTPTGSAAGSGASTSFTNRGGSITVGGTSQAFAPINGYRNGYSFQNISAGDLYLLENAASATSASATNATVKVPAGGYYYNDPGFVPQGLISVFGATTGQAWLGKDF